MPKNKKKLWNVHDVYDYVISLATNLSSIIETEKQQKPTQEKLAISEHFCFTIIEREVNHSKITFC